MYYTGLDPFTGKPVYTATDYREKQLQRALLQWRKPQNRPMIFEAMKYCTEAGKADLRELIGMPRDGKTEERPQHSGNAPKKKDGRAPQNPQNRQKNDRKPPEKRADNRKPDGRNHAKGDYKRPDTRKTTSKKK